MSLQSLPLDLPFIPDKGWMRFVGEHGERVHSLHVPLHLPGAADARPPTTPQEAADLAGLLALAPAPRKHALLNSRFHPPELYGDKIFMASLVERLQLLDEAGQLHGLIYDDHYLLRALADAAPGLCSRLEAIPSVNCTLDTLPRALWHLRYAEQAGFLPAGQIVPDRGLNRRMAELETLVKALREKRPELKIVLLANEGCLPQCPYKPAHDAHMALGHMRGVSAEHLAANRARGCTRQFAERPALLFSAPFIRPEDVGAYAHCADAIKVCGRSRGVQTMQKIAVAYFEGRYEGNLLWLLDTQECLSAALHVVNEDLPLDFVRMVAECDADCDACGVCETLAAEHVRRLRAGDALRS